MEHRTLSTSDLKVSVFGLGTMTFGAESDEETSHALLDRFVEAGGTFIDTADVYSDGVAEEYVGTWLKSRPGIDVTISTKARFAMSDDPTGAGAGRAHLTRALDASLRRLGMDAIDLYWVHGWDETTPLHETMDTLHGFVVAGKVKAIGVSNYLAWHLERAMSIAEHQGSTQIAAYQPQYNLLDRQVEVDHIPLCIDRNVSVFPWSPLGGGWLTGKYSQEMRPTGATRLGEDPNRGVEAYDLRNTPTTWAILDDVRSIADEHGVPMAQVALNWVRNRPSVASVLLGARTVEQLDLNLGALDWNLQETEMARLTEVSAPGIPDYPHKMMEKWMDIDVWRHLGTD